MQNWKLPWTQKLFPKCVYFQTSTRKYKRRNPALTTRGVRSSAPASLFHPSRSSVSRAAAPSGSGPRAPIAFPRRSRARRFCRVHRVAGTSRRRFRERARVERAARGDQSRGREESWLKSQCRRRNLEEKSCIEYMKDV